MTNQQKETEIVVVLDRSGSMMSIATAAVSGFNELIKEQQKAEGEAFVTLVQFDDRYEMCYESLNVKHVKELINGETFVPRGSTAMYDAIGRTINGLKTDRDILFVIITDGHENASKEYKKDMIKELITKKEKENQWKFLFLAANQDAVLAGDSIGISKDYSMTFTADALHTTNSMKNISSKLSSYRSAKMSDENFMYSANVGDILGFTSEDRKDSVE